MAAPKRKAPKRKPASKKPKSTLPEHLENVETMETGRQLIRARGKTPMA